MTATETFYEQHASKGCAKPEPAAEFANIFGGIACKSCGYEVVVAEWLSGGSEIDRYRRFLDQKSHFSDPSGFEPLWLPDSLFDFQRELVTWALRQGRCALFEDCGLGKTLQQLVWAENVVRKTNKRVLILAPLAVSAQTVREGEKFGIEVHRSGGQLHSGIVATNYERLEYFDSGDFIGCVCDESSILKHYDGVRRNQITLWMKKLPYRLLCTATPSPNDYTELGTSSEALGYLGFTDMLMRYFYNDQHTVSPKRQYRTTGGGDGKWRFKGHAVQPFWRWVCSWSRAIRKPSDMGFDDGNFILPSLTEQQYVVKSAKRAEGMLFSLPAIGMREQRDERRRTLEERCEKVAELVDHPEQSLVWCHLNDEGNLLEKLIPGAKQVSGSQDDDEKEELILAFASGQLRVLVSKAKITGFGLNFQNCAHETFFPSHSFEQYYQGVRRCWRFGQKQPVTVDIVTTEGELNVLKNLQRKSKAAAEMFEQLVGFQNQALAETKTNQFTKIVEKPAWL